MGQKLEGYQSRLGALRRIILVRRSVVIGLVIAIIVLGTGLFFFSNKSLPIAPVLNLGPIHTVIGQSVEGRNIDAYTYSKGETLVAFVGGIHGGYEWNSVVLAYKFIDYLDTNPEAIPENMTVVVIPSANPDGVYRIVGKEGRFTSADVPKDKPTEAGRFNVHEVDLNRNFDCKWQPESTWRQKVVSAGSKPFSEPEAIAIRDFVLENTPESVIFWHSQSGAVYASECENGILPETLKIMNVYAQASGYRAVKAFDAYATTGDAEGWLASINIPAITVEMTTHETLEWEKNLAGIKALFEYYRK